MNHSLKDVIINELENLNTAQQKMLLEFLLKLKFSNQKKNPRMNLVDFSGAISKDDLAVMEKAIDNGCEKVDLNEW